jgi:hypothetical protein
MRAKLSKLPMGKKVKPSDSGGWIYGWKKVLGGNITN